MLNLQERGLELAREFNLVELLNKYGEAHLVGNLALGTTVRPDIDFLIYAPMETWQKGAEGIISDLAAQNLADYNVRELKQSRKLFISYNVYDGEIKWDLHITFTEPGGDYLADSYRFFMDYGSKFTTDKTRTIKRLKQYFLKRIMLWNGMSYYIYRAVIDEGAKNIADIFEYLKINGINISRFKK